MVHEKRERNSTSKFGGNARSNVDEWTDIETGIADNHHTVGLTAGGGPVTMKMEKITESRNLSP